MTTNTRRGFLRNSALVALAAATGRSFPASSQAWPKVTVHLSPTCGCCKAWVRHLQREGFEVAVVEVSDVSPKKRAAGVPEKLESCHTAIVADYFVEGHVPAADLQRLLRERPPALGLAVPEMPVGSPGMAVPGVKPDAYDTLLVLHDGRTQVWAKH